MLLGCKVRHPWTVSLHYCMTETLRLNIAVGYDSGSESGPPHLATQLPFIASDGLSHRQTNPSDGSDKSDRRSDKSDSQTKQTVRRSDKSDGQTKQTVRQSDKSDGQIKQTDSQTNQTVRQISMDRQIRQTDRQINKSDRQNESDRQTQQVIINNREKSVSQANQTDRPILLSELTDGE